MSKKLSYSVWEHAWATVFAVYLLAAFVWGLWLIGDTFAGTASLVAWLKTSSDATLQPILILTLLCMAGGWLGGTLSAMRSLQTHYAGPIEYDDAPKLQEKSKFRIAWWTRWIWGPWIGAGLALIVFALVRSGILLFANTSPAGSTDAAAAIVEKFAALGLGGLVGLGAKDVVEKLIVVLKSWLRAEEPAIADLTITMEDGKAEYDLGAVVKFNLEPKIAVTWAIDPPNIGTITNGVLRVVDKLPDGIKSPCQVVVTATSKTDANRAASTTVTVKK